MSWAKAWEEARTPWDAGKHAPPLEEALERLQEAPRNGLVTGCGAGWDALELARRGIASTGLDIAPGAARRFQSLRAELGIDPANARVALADFFTWSPPERFDFIWDYTFLCALPPSVRHRWAARMTSLITPGGTLATLIFPDIQPGPDYSGPPFPLHPEDVQALLSSTFRRVHLDRPRESHPARAGNEWLALWRAR